jgi:hypothetical protein
MSGPLRAYIYLYTTKDDKVFSLLSREGEGMYRK